MQNLEKYITVQIILTIAIIGAGVFLVLKKTNQPKKGLDIRKLAIDDSTEKTQRESKALDECKAIADSSRFSTGFVRETFLKDCVQKKLTENKIS